MWSEIQVNCLVDIKVRAQIYSSSSQLFHIWTSEPHFQLPTGYLFLKVNVFKAEFITSLWQRQLYSPNILWLLYTSQPSIVRRVHKTGSGQWNVSETDVHHCWAGIKKKVHTQFSSISLFSFHVTEEVTEVVMCSRWCGYEVVEPLSAWIPG